MKNTNLALSPKSELSPFLSQIDKPKRIKSSLGRNKASLLHPLWLTGTEMTAGSHGKWALCLLILTCWGPQITAEPPPTWVLKGPQGGAWAADIDACKDCCTDNKQILISERPFSMKVSLLPQSALRQPMHPFIHSSKSGMTLHFTYDLPAAFQLFL